jgi:hypothetical protein
MDAPRKNHPADRPAAICLRPRHTMHSVRHHRAKAVPRAPCPPCGRRRVLSTCCATGRAGLGRTLSSLGRAGSMHYACGPAARVLAGGRFSK